jgi:uridine kinase
MCAAIASGRQRLLGEVAKRVPTSTRDCVRVGIDGVDGAGKTVFADDLAATLRAAERTVIRVSADDFHQVRAIRHRRGRDSPQGFWLDSYDYPALRNRVLDPLGPGGSRQYQAACHDLKTDQPVDPPIEQAPLGAVLVLDGLFLHRDELAGIWDLSVFLQVPFSVSWRGRPPATAATRTPITRRWPATWGVSGCTSPPVSLGNEPTSSSMRPTSTTPW